MMSEGGAVNIVTTGGDANLTGTKVSGATGASVVALNGNVNLDAAQSVETSHSRRDDPHPALHRHAEPVRRRRLAAPHHSHQPHGAWAGNGGGEGGVAPVSAAARGGLWERDRRPSPRRPWPWRRVLSTGNGDRSHETIKAIAIMV